MAQRLHHLLGLVRRRLRHPGAIEPVMLTLAGVTGLLTGTMVWVLISLVELVQFLVWSTRVPPWQLVAVPTLGGLVVGLLVSRVVPEARGGGVVTTMESLAVRGGHLRGRVPLAGTLATGLALGTGASGGREGPIVLIGGAIGSLVGRLLPLDEERTRSMVAAGAAAGIGATFNAPIGGMLFAIELLLGGIRRSGSLQAVVVASVVSAVTARQLVGEDLPLFQARPGLGLGEPVELLLYAALGLAAVLVAWGFRTLGTASRELFSRVNSRVGAPLGAALGGLGVGLIALAFPEVLGEGSDLPGIDGAREPIQAMLDGGFGLEWSAAGLLVLLVLAKLLATSLSVGSGSAVGIFAPTLFTGAALGGAFGIAATQLISTETADPGGFALVGMAAVFAATVRAPLTAIIIVFELTGSYDLVLPLMLAVGIAMFITEMLGWESIYLWHLRERGVIYGQPDDLDVLQLVTVEEVMSAADITVTPETSVEELRALFAAGGAHGYVVVDEQDRLVGVVAASDLERPGDTAEEICTRRVVTVGPSDPVFRAVRRMASLDIGRVPVLDPIDRRVVGVFRRADVVRAYQRGITRSLGSQQRAQAGRLRDLSGVRFVEVVVAPDSPLADALVRDVRWPPKTVLTSIRRSGEVVVPTGDTQLRGGDELVVLTGQGDDLTKLVTQSQPGPAG
ncbi:MAG: chloride channel protein [Nitriliruptoraceae bacterium]